MSMTNVELLRSKMCRDFDVKETVRLLKYGDNLYKFLSWGVSKMVNYENRGLLLKVSGRCFKSYVFITLNGLDLYDVCFISTHGNEVDEITDIYFDQLVEIIDKKVETVSGTQYKKGD